MLLLGAGWNPVKTTGYLQWQSHIMPHNDERIQSYVATSIALLLRSINFSIVARRTEFLARRLIALLFTVGNDAVFLHFQSARLQRGAAVRQSWRRPKIKSSEHQEIRVNSVTGYTYYNTVKARLHATSKLFFYSAPFFFFLGLYSAITIA
jgi:hypothetical protein